MPEEFLYKDLTYKIRGAIFKVWKELGPVFKESTYHRALAKQFQLDGIVYESNPCLPIYFAKEKVGIYKPDFIVDKKVLIEIKALPLISRLEEKQIWYYLRGTDYKVALLVNFGSRKLEIKRWVYDKARKTHSA